MTVTSLNINAHTDTT